MEFPSISIPLGLNSLLSSQPSVTPAPVRLASLSGCFSHPSFPYGVYIFNPALSPVELFPITRSLAQPSAPIAASALPTFSIIKLPV
ncbi:hypothetical protein, partial [Cloacibacillus porcorum]